MNGHQSFLSSSNHYFGNRRILNFRTVAVRSHKLRSHLSWILVIHVSVFCSDQMIRRIDNESKFQLFLIIWYPTAIIGVHVTKAEHYAGSEFLRNISTIIWSLGQWNTWNLESYLSTIRLQFLGVIHRMVFDIIYRCIWRVEPGRTDLKSKSSRDVTL